MSVAPDSPWIPVPEDWTETCWESVLAAADGLDVREARAARVVLRKLFPPRWTQSDAARHHPLGSWQLFHAGRLELLELALAVLCLGVTLEEANLLRKAGSYATIAAELRGKLFALASGAVLVPPPKGGKQCECIARWPGGDRLAIEVKHPDVKSRAEDYRNAMTRALLKLMPAFDVLSDHAEGFRATIHFSERLRELRRPGFAPLAAWVSEAYDRAADIAAGSAPIGSHELGPLGSVSVLHAPGQQHVSVDGAGIVADPVRIGSGLARGVLRKANQQIEASGIPGVIILDVQRDPIVRNALGYLRRWVERKASIVAVMVFDRTASTVDDRLYCCVDILPGPRFDAIEPLLDALEVCDAGHIHYSSVCSLETPCPLSWRSRVVPTD